MQLKHQGLPYRGKSDQRAENGSWKPLSFLPFIGSWLSLISRNFPPLLACRQLGQRTAPLRSRVLPLMGMSTLYLIGIQKSRPVSCIHPPVNRLTLKNSEIEDEGNALGWLALYSLSCCKPRWCCLWWSPRSRKDRPFHWAQRCFEAGWCCRWHRCVSFYMSAHLLSVLWQQWNFPSQELVHVIWWVVLRLKTKGSLSR